MKNARHQEEVYTPAERRALLEAEMAFMEHLLRRPLFSDRTPNAFERLREYQKQVERYRTESQGLAPEGNAAWSELERRWNRWKYELYQYLNTKLDP